MVASRSPRLLWWLRRGQAVHRIGSRPLHSFFGENPGVHLNSKPRIDGRHPMSFLLVSAVLALVCGVASYHARGGVGNSLWDLDAYTRAVHDYADGGNPYNTAVNDVFVYHPFVLQTFYLIEAMPPHFVRRLTDSPLRTLLLWLYAISAACFLWQLSRFAYEHAAPLGRPRIFDWSFSFVILGALGYGRAGATSYLSGNLTPYLHLAVLAVLLKYLRSGSRRYLQVFVGAVAVASLVKPYMLAYLLVCIPVGTLRQTLRYGCVVIAVVACTWVSATYLTPTEYGAFVMALRHQVLVTGDVGYSAFGLVHAYVPESAALIAHVAMLVALAYAVFVHLPKWGFDTRSAEGLLLLVVLAILANPRMKEYDVFPLILMLFCFLYLRYPGHALVLMCAGMLTATVPVLSEQLNRNGYDVPPLPPVFTDSHYSEIAGLLVIGLGVWLCCRAVRSPPPLSG